MDYQFRSNAHKMKLFIPTNERKQKFIQFVIAFERCRRRSQKGLYKLKFVLGKDLMTAE